MRAQGAAPGELGGELRGGDIDEGIERILYPRPCARILVCANPWCGSHFEQRHSGDRLCSECARWARIIELHLRCREMQP